MMLPRSSPQGFRRVLATASGTLLWLCLASPAPAQKCLHEGFKVELLYQVPDVEHPSVVACDDKGNLFIGEDPMDMRGPTTKEFDRILYVTFNADGSVKRKTVFAENLSAVFGMIWHDGALYVMHAPHYTMFRDTDGDGVADVRKELAGGFGPPAGVYGFNDHIVTGTHLGMDGFVYVSVGDKGIQKAKSFGDHSEITLEGGGIVRMKLDGTQLENFTSGTRNHLDTAMNSLDDIFTYDNTDDGLGWWTRFTHHVPTGYYGYPYDYHPHPDRHLPRISEHGGGSPVGGSGYREAAWPAKYKDAIFYCEWGKGKVQVFYLKKNGATYDATRGEFLVNAGSGEFRPLDVCFSPDGKHMYLADWNYGGWVNQKRAGRVFRITYVGEDAPKVPASPFEKGTNDAGKLTVEKLIDTLKHPAHSQRMLAQWELVKRGRDAIEPTVALLKDRTAPTHGRIHAAWVLYHLGITLNSYNPSADLVYALHNGPDDLRAQAARAIGTGRLTGDSDRALKGLIHRAKNDTDASVRMHAAVALGRIGDPAATGELFLSLDDDDTFARFAKVQALRAINTWDLAPAYTNASEPRIREGAILAMTEVYDEGAVKALAFAIEVSPYPALRARAVQAISEVHRKSEPYTKGWWGTQPARGKPARPKKIEWSGTHLVLDTLADALKDDSPIVRLAAIRAQQAIGDAGVLAALRSLVTTEKDNDVRAAAMRALAAMKDRQSAPLFAGMVTDTTLPVPVREEAVRAIVSRGERDSAKSLLEVALDRTTPAPLLALVIESMGHLEVALATGAAVHYLKHDDTMVRVKSIETLARLDGKDASERIANMLADRESAVRQTALRALATLKASEAIPQIIEVARDSSVKREAAAALAAMPDRRALPVLLDFITDRNADVRKDAILALVALREQVIDDLIALHKANELRPEARRELGSLFASPKPINELQLIGA